MTTFVDEGPAFGADPVGLTGPLTALGRVDAPAPVLAFDARQGCPHTAGAALDTEHPRALLPRRLVTHVLAVSTLEHDHPVTRIIAFEAHDRPRRTRHSPLSSPIGTSVSAPFVAAFAARRRVSTRSA